MDGRASQEDDWKAGPFYGEKSLHAKPNQLVDRQSCLRRVRNREAMQSVPRSQSSVLQHVRKALVSSLCQVLEAMQRRLIRLVTRLLV